MALSKDKSRITISVANDVYDGINTLANAYGVPVGTLVSVWVGQTYFAQKESLKALENRLAVALDSAVEIGKLTGEKIGKK